MTGCCVPGCHNSTRKGVKMHAFPRDPSRRTKWAENIGRANWAPKESSKLCEIHFAPEMWEKPREDGKRKLKCNAIPTVFAGLKILDQNAQESTDIMDITSSQEESLNEKKSQPNKLTSDEVLPNVFTTSDEISTLTIANKKLEAIVSKQQRIIQLMRRKLKAARYREAQLLKKIELNEASGLNSVRSVFNDDQLRALKLHHKRGKTVGKWSTKTIQKALQLKFACGASGYEELLKQNFPLPSLRTLRRALENLPFTSGISDDMLEFLKTKVASFTNDTDKECGLVLDEMSITEATSYDTATKSYFGDVTLPNTSGKATHVLVFMLGGTASRWKQIIGYYFTGDGYDGSILKPIIFEIVQKVQAIGLQINSITSDMGPINQALWRACGIVAGRHSKNINCIQHLCDPSRKLFFIADVPHILKNILECLLNNKIIYLPKEIQAKYRLPTNEVYAEHYIDLAKSQDALEFLIAARLKMEDLQAGHHFKKMRVNRAKNLLSRDVAAALELLTDENTSPKYLATAFFVKTVAKWFCVMTSRHPNTALGKHNIEKFNETIAFLEEVIFIFENLKVGRKGTFKPMQRGVIMSTRSIIELRQYLLDKRGFQFVLTGRFTQDCVENLFSVVRSKHVIPTALQFKNDLKLIAVSQYMREISTSNYDNDDREYIADFLEYLKTKTPLTVAEDSDASIVAEDSESSITASSVSALSNLEKNSLYSVCGYLIRSIQRNCASTVCANCIGSLGSKQPSKYAYSKLVHLRCYKSNTLFFTNEQTFKFMLKLEYIFRKYKESLKCRNVIANPHTFLLHKFMVVDAPHILNCHNLKTKLINRFITFRLKITCKRKTKARICRDSKSMAMHNVVK